jgi:predicted nuclease of predicted toxin-antitoxin system
MRFLAHENIPGDAVVALRDAGHDVEWIRTEAPGADDATVLARARGEQRVLLTFDKDFGELAWNQRLPADCGIVLFRMRVPPASRVGEALTAILSSRNDWSGHFAVVQSGRIRMRRLPGA